MILIPGFYSPYYPSAVSHSCRSVLKGKLLLSSSRNCTSFRWEFGAERGSKDCLLQTVNLLLPRAVPECTASCSQKEQSYVCAVLFCSVKVPLFPHHPERRNYFRKNGNIPANLSEIASLAKKKKKKVLHVPLPLLLVPWLYRKSNVQRHYVYIYMYVYKKLSLFSFFFSYLGLGVFHNENIPLWIGENLEWK